MGKKRAHGEGSVYRDPRGFWRGAVTMPDGKRRYLSGRTRGEVAAKVQAAAVSSRRGELAPDAQTTLAAYLAAWLEIIRPTVRPWTWTGYESCLRTHVVPAIGRVKLLDLQPRHVSQVMAAMAEGGSAPSTVARVRSVLSTALAAAVRAGAIPRNAASLAPPPRQERARRAWLDAGQAATFLAACQGHPDGPILSLILLLGLRRGEAMALRWTDYSPERATLDVHRTVSSARGPRTENAPKTSAGRRTLPVPAPAAAILDAERRRQEAEGLWSPGGTCLLNRQGKPYNPPTLLKHLRALLQDAGLPSIRLHDLRHSTASILLEHGVAARVVADLLGHSSTAITLDLYSHVTARLVVSATDVMGALSPPIAAPPAAPMPPENADNPGGAGIVAAPPDDRIT